MQLKENPPRLEGVEALRALAALMIIIYHMVMIPNIEIPEYLSVIKLHFAQGVPLFYALSGFVLAYGYLDKLNDRAQITRFYIRRFFRIAPLFYVLLATWVVIAMLKEWQVSFQDIVLNALLLFGLIPGKHESIVWAGWSIGVEILFYLFFPVIVVLVCSLRSGILVLAIALLVSSAFFTAAENLQIGSYSYLNIMTHLPTFLSGVLAFLIWRETGFFQGRKQGALLFALTIIGILSIVYVPSVYKVLREVGAIRLDLYIWSIMFMILILAICIWPNPFCVNWLTTGMGRISFSLYLWHPLIVKMLMGMYAESVALFSSGLLNFLICTGVTLGLVSLVAHISFRIIETPGIEYGKGIANKY